jgi:hypothetical protein
MLEIAPLIKSIIDLLNTLLAGVPPEQRSANATVWFFMWWPIGKRVLARAGFTPEELAHIEASVKGGSGAA